MINYFKNDFRSVHEAIKFLSNGKVPTWVIIIYYVLLAPIGLLLYPFVKIYCAIQLKRWTKWEAE